MELVSLTHVDIVSYAEILKAFGQDPLENQYVKQAAENILKNPLNYSGDEVCYAAYVQSNSPKQ
jgi:hypothetical protein